jgi:hypothetical protein
MPRMPLFPTIVVRLPFKTTSTDDGRSRTKLRWPFDRKAPLVAGPAPRLAQVPLQAAARSTAVSIESVAPTLHKALPALPVDPRYAAYVTEFCYSAKDRAETRERFTEAIEWNASEGFGLRAGFVEREGQLLLTSDLASIVHLSNLAGRRTPAFHACQKKLLADAVAYFDETSVSRRPHVPDWREDEEPLAIARRLLSASRRAGGGLVLGEDHHEIGPKKFLVQNMRALGVKVLFLEHLLFEKNQDHLDRYQAGTGVAMSPRLRFDVEQLNDRLMDATFVSDFGLRDAYVAEKQKYNYLTVVEAARACGVEVRTIDCEASYSLGALSVYSRKTEDIERQQAMNYLAAKRVEDLRREGGGAWVMLVGNAHTRTRDGVPGVAELTASLSLRLHDSYPAREFSEAHETLRTDVTLGMPLESAR